MNKIHNVKLIKNMSKTFDQTKVGFLEYFTDISWIKEFKPDNYQRRMKRAKKQTAKTRKVLQRFGSNMDILVCHQPPYGVLDKVGADAPKHWQGKHAGSKAILEYIKKSQPKYVFCGHIHKGKGMKKIGRTEVYNLGVCGYKTINIQ